MLLFHLPKVTMFSEDIFAGLISLIFIIDGVRPIIANFADGVMPLTNCFFEALLFIYTFGLATYLSGMRRTPWMLRPLRNLLANFSVTIALISASALAAIYASDVSLRMLQVDAEFAPNLELASGEKRPWVVNPSGIETEFPAWGIAFAIVPAIGFAVLGYLDQNLTSVIVNRPSNGLKKGPGYHLDLFVRGAITLPVCAVLGLPLSVASTVPSITHVACSVGQSLFNFLFVQFCLILRLICVCCLLGCWTINTKGINLEEFLSCFQVFLYVNTCKYGVENMLKPDKNALCADTIAAYYSRVLNDAQYLKLMPAAAVCWVWFRRGCALSFYVSAMQSNWVLSRSDIAKGPFQHRSEIMLNELKWSVNCIEWYWM